MSRVTIISPLHIGSGLTYENFLIYQNKRYDFDHFISKVFPERKSQLLDPSFLKHLTTLSNSSSQIAKEQIRASILPRPSQIQELVPMYSVLPKLEEKKLNEKSINEFIKTMNQPYIPGSTLKGYIMNVIISDAIENDSRLREFVKQKIDEIESQLGEKKRNEPSRVQYWNRMRAYRDYEKIERDALIIAAKSLLCRDILFPENIPVSIYFLNRQTKNGSIPQVSEFIEGEFSIPDDFITICHFGPIDPNTPSMVRIFAEAIISRLREFKEKFPSMNAGFMRRTIDFQKRFIEHLPDDERVSKEDILDQLADILSRLAKGQIVIHLGRYTNFVTKSVSLALDHEFYERHFENIFSPGRKSKPFRIGTMNLLAYPNDSNDFFQIPGYVAIEW